MRWLVPILSLAACTDGIDTGDTGDTGAAACPDGLYRTTNAEAQVTALNIDGLAWVIGLDPTRLIGGEATACASTDHTHSRLILDIDGAAFARVEQVTPTTGEQDLNGTAATLTVDLVGAPEPFTVTNGDWVTGTWTVETVSPEQRSYVQGEARPTGHVLQIDLFTRVGL